MFNTNAVHVSDRFIGYEPVRCSDGWLHDKPAYVSIVWRLNIGATSLDDIEIISRHEYRHEAELVAEKLNAQRQEG